MNFLLFNFVFNLLSISYARMDHHRETSASHWNDLALIDIEQRLVQQQNTNQARNVILFLGDGMGMTTVTAGRIRKGQMQNELGEDFQTEMEQLSYTGFSKTCVHICFVCYLFLPKVSYLDTISIFKRQIQRRQPLLIYAELKEIWVPLEWMEEP